MKGVGEELKPLCKDCVLGVIFLVYADDVWIMNDEYNKIGELWTYLGGPGEVFVAPSKEVLEEVGARVGTQ